MGGQKSLSKIIISLTAPVWSVKVSSGQSTEYTSILAFHVVIHGNRKQKQSFSDPCQQLLTPILLAITITGRQWISNNFYLISILQHTEKRLLNQYLPEEN